jgi:hypothetical protein
MRRMDKGPNAAGRTPQVTRAAAEAPGGRGLGRRFRRARGSMLVAGATLAATVIVSACGGSSSNNSSSSGGSGKPLDTSRVEKSIELSIVGQKHEHAVVTCPPVEQKQGLTFTCYATGTVGSGAHKAAFRTPFTVEQLNGKGYVYYHS